MNKLLVPMEFQIPEALETDKIRLRMLKVTDVVKDYDAVMTSISHLQKTNPFGPENTWPANDLTLEQDLIDLGWHQKEFQMRSSFAYTVMNLDESECLGCMYIFPSTNTKYDAQIIMRVRESKVSEGLDEHLFSTVTKWIDDKRPFKNPGYPERSITWQSWNESK